MSHNQLLVLEYNLFPRTTIKAFSSWFFIPWNVYLRANAQQGVEVEVGRGSLPCPHLETENCAHFGQKGPNCIHPWDKSPIQNVAEKAPKVFPAGSFFFLAFLTKVLLKCPNFKTPLLS